MQFVDMVAPWLDALPAGYRYVLETGNPEYVVPEYLECLRVRNIGHLLRHNIDRSLLDRIQEPEILTAGAVVVRREQEDAGPPVPRRRHNRGGDEEWKLGVIATVRRCVELGITLYISVPEEETALMEETVALMDGDLAKLSPFRKRLVA